MIIPPPSSLSLRATSSLKNTSNALWDVLIDLWHPQTNPNGYVSLGLADNTVMQEQLLRRMNSGSFSAPCLALGDTIAGSIRLRTAIAHLLNRHLHPSKPLQPSQIITTNGVTSAIEHCSWAVCDPGEGILLGRPYYRGFTRDLCLRPATKIVPVSFGDLDPLSVSAVARYEEAVIRSRDQGCAIRSLMLCNPHNPLGRCYSRPFLVELMRMCQKFGIHLISDEIYALAVWRRGQDEETPMEPFTSLLSINTEGIIDPSLVHVLWGVSKDFGANGARLGVVISQGNPDLLESIRGVGQFSSISGFADSLITTVLEDEEFVDRYVHENRAKLAELYAYVVKFLDDHGIPYARGSNAAFFVWCDLLTPYMKARPSSVTDESDAARAGNKELMAKLASHKVHLGNGDDFVHEQPGWFRITFSQHREHIDEGLRRIVQVIQG
ncbi:putative aspartate aminotransferase [Dactylonectria macrodidyma]|uniref:Aspartate aminotransferase n=1 Tax=Dactylonectria macrodidyma TaxID=307937 RepID=A0A9P9ERT9_9HYPO|nr:putative aspartate aminotransferase [Dactylonectria macrodidyma]